MAVSNPAGPAPTTTQSFFSICESPLRLLRLVSLMGDVVLFKRMGSFFGLEKVLVAVLIVVEDENAFVRFACRRVVERRKNGVKSGCFIMVVSG